MDIETVPDLDRWQRPEPPPAPPTPEGAAPPPPPVDDRRRDRDNFPPIWAHRVIVVGFLWLDRDYRLRDLGVIDSANAGTRDDRERTLLANLSHLIGRARPILVTYNGRNFDFPVIMMRSLTHALSMRWYYRDRDVRYRYTDEGHLDLCDWLAEHGAIRAGKLDQIARLIGLPGKVGVDGSQVEGLYTNGELAAIEKYCIGDVAQTAFLFLRFRLLQGELTIADYRDRVGALVDALARDGRVNDVLEGLDRASLLGPAEPDDVSESEASLL